MLFCTTAQKVIMNIVSISPKQCYSHQAGSRNLQARRTHAVVSMREEPRPLLLVQLRQHEFRTRNGSERPDDCTAQTMLFLRCVVSRCPQLVYPTPLCRSLPDGLSLGFSFGRRRFHGATRSRGASQPPMERSVRIGVDLRGRLDDRHEV